MNILAFRCLAALGLLAVAACSQSPRTGVKSPAAVQMIDNGQQVSDVIGALEAGDIKRARSLLKKMTARDPNDPRVRLLQESMVGDPVELLGSKAFNYTSKTGDTMTNLSKRYLGDRLKFFLLARYNGMSSAKLSPGMVLRIPGVEPTPNPVAKPKTEPRPVVAAPNTRPAATGPRAPVANPALANALRARGLAALNQGRIADAVAALRKARAVDPSNIAVQRDLSRAERVLTSVRARK